MVRPRRIDPGPDVSFQAATYRLGLDAVFWGDAFFPGNVMQITDGDTKIL